jgi:hypothetical protein
LNGSNQWLEVSSDVFHHLNVSDNDFTLCVWVYNYPGGEDIQNIMSQTDMGGTGRIFLDRMGSGQQYKLSSFIGGARNVSTGAGILQNQWHHLAIVGNGQNNTLTFYVDGQQNGSVVQTNGFESNAGSFRIGVQKSGERNFWNGKIDELYLFKRVLSPDEINRVKNNDWFEPSSIHNHTYLGNHVYPNPASSQFSVLTDKDVRMLTLSGPDGRSFLISDQASHIDVSGLTAGYYLLQVEFHDNTTGFGKLIINH